MPKKPLFESENPDSLEFIKNMLKENSEDLRALLTEVRKVADRIDDVCELTTFKRIEEKINNLQNDVSEFMDSSSKSIQAHASTPPTSEKNEENDIHPTSLNNPDSNLPSITMRFKNWEDFQTFASKAQTVSFTFRESDKMFEADALKDNQVLAYVGEMPKVTALLKLFLSSQLKVPEEKVFEGILSKA